MRAFAIAGLAGGGVYALLGVCLVLSYRVSAVVNFSQTFAATLAIYGMSPMLDHKVNQWVYLACCVALGGIIFAFQGWILTKLFPEAGVLVRSTVTIGMAISLFGIALRLFPGRKQRPFPTLFSSYHFRLANTTVTGIVMASLIMAIGISVAVWLILNRTRLGIMLRAVSARPTTAELMGVRTMPLQVLVWLTAGLLTTSAVLLIAPTRRSIANMSIELVAPPLAAAVFGAFKSFRLTVAGGLLIGMIESMAQDWTNKFGGIGNFRPAIAFVVVSGALLWSQRRETWGEAR